MIGVIEAQVLSVAIDMLRIDDFHVNVQLTTPLAEQQLEITVSGSRVAAESQQLVVQPFAPVFQAAIQAYRALQRVGVEAFEVFYGDRQIIEQILPAIEQRGDAFGRQQLGVGLTLNQQVFHLDQLPIAEPGDHQQREPQQHDLCAQSRAAYAAQQPHWLDPESEQVNSRPTIGNRSHIRF